MNRRNLGYVIALAALLISIPRYIATFEEIDPWAVTAYGMGILLAGGAAYMVDAWASARKRRVKRADHLLLALAINLIYEPLLLTPFVLARLWSQSLAEVMHPAFAVLWSIMVTLAPVLLVFGVIYAVWFHQQPSDRRTNVEQNRTGGEQTLITGEQDGTDGEHICPDCGDAWPTARHLAGHMNKHKKRGSDAGQ